MNWLEKVKLKALLRNCDYELAGIVIKQQYYDERRNTELNQLIDRYMKAPSFEQALKLIEHNEMLVYYFTESSNGGLYVRKNNKPGNNHEAPPPVVMEDSSPMIDQEGTETTEIDVRSEPESSVDGKPHDKFRTKNEGEGPMAEARKETPVTQQEEASASSDSIEAIPVAATMTTKPPSRVMKRSFPNVVSTLEIDIATMMEQLNDYRRTLKERPTEAETVKDWIRTLEQAVDEFSAAVDLLKKGESSQ